MYSFPSDVESYDVMYQYGVEFDGRRLNFLNAYNANKLISNEKKDITQMKRNLNPKLNFATKTGILPPSLLNSKVGNSIEPPNELVDNSIPVGSKSGGKRKKRGVVGGKKKKTKRFDFL
jgi:hypothetical protein